MSLYLPYVPLPSLPYVPLPPLLSLTVAFHRATTQPCNQLIVHEKAGTMRPIWSPRAARPRTGARCTRPFMPANALWQALSHRFSDKLLDSGRGFLNSVLVKRLRAMTQLTTGLSDDSPFQREYTPQVEGKEKGTTGHQGPDRAGLFGVSVWRRKAKLAPALWNLTWFISKPSTY